MRKRLVTFSLLVLVACFVVHTRMQASPDEGQSLSVTTAAAGLNSSKPSPGSKPAPSLRGSESGTTIGLEAAGTNAKASSSLNTITGNERELERALSGVRYASDWLSIFRWANDETVGIDPVAAHKTLIGEMKKRSDYDESLLEAFHALRPNPRFSVEAAGLLELLAESSHGRHLVHDLAEREMLEASSREVPLPDETTMESELDDSLSTDESMILSIIAHEVFLETARSDQESFDGTLKALSVQPNHNVRSAIFDAYVRTFPGRRVELAARMQDLGIIVPGYSTRANDQSFETSN